MPWRPPLIQGQVVWAGWVLTVLTALLLLFSAATKLARSSGAVEEFTRLGYDPDVIRWVAVVQLVSVVMFLFPRTAVVGAILITAYMGGGTAMHLRAGDPVILPVTTAVVVWTALVLRDQGIRGINFRR